VRSQKQAECTVVAGGREERRDFHKKRLKKKNKNELVTKGSTNALPKVEKKKRKKKG